MMTVLSLVTTFVIILTNQCVSLRGATEYEIVGLLPLSGPEASKGQAQLTGIRLIMQEELYRINSIPGVIVTFRYNDTKCQPLLEAKAVVDRLVRSERYIIVLGGGCHGQRELLASSLSSFHRLIPQVTFEAAHKNRNVGVVDNVIRTRVVADDALNVLVDYIDSAGWKKIAVLYSRSTTQNILQLKLKRRNIKVGLSLNYAEEDYGVILKASRLRPVAFCGDENEAARVICSCETVETRGRYWWLVLTLSKDRLYLAIQTRCGTEILNHITMFQPTPEYNDENLERFQARVSYHFPRLDRVLAAEAALAHDTAGMLVQTLGQVVEKQFTTREAFTEWFNMKLIHSIYNNTILSKIVLEEDGTRKVPVRILKRNDSTMGKDQISETAELDGIPLWLFIFMSFLAFLGIIYSVSIIIYNIMQHNNKIIKMTSPNINVVILLGAIVGYGTIVMYGIDSGLVPLAVMAALLQAATFTLAVSFTVVYGAAFTKAWRVYLIFKNMNFNGKMTRDEHILLGVVFLIFIDLAIMLPWTLIDPIECTRKALYTVYQVENSTDVTVHIDDCSSSLQALWVSLLYVYKLTVLLIGLFLTRQTRHVTLPSLQEAKPTYIIVYTVVVMAILCLPVLLVDNVGMKVKYSIGALAIWIVLTVTITVMFIPKVLLVRNETAPNDPARFHFSESLRKTQDSIKKCSLCFCCNPENEDQYGQEMLATEIEALKKTINQKDSTIRELTDRLYYGAERFQQYLTSPRRDGINSPDCRPAKEPERGKISKNVTASTRGGESDVYTIDCVSGEHSSDSSDEFDMAAEHVTNDYARELSHSKARMVAKRPDCPLSYIENIPTNKSACRTYLSTPSNNDSAIDNNFPSSDGSDYGLRDLHFSTASARRRTDDVSSMPIDLEAMENDARPRQCRSSQHKGPNIQKEFTAIELTSYCDGGKPLAMIRV